MCVCVCWCFVGASVGGGGGGVLRNFSVRGFVFVSVWLQEESRRGKRREPSRRVEISNVGERQRPPLILSAR